MRDRLVVFGFCISCTLVSIEGAQRLNNRWLRRKHAVRYRRLQFVARHPGAEDRAWHRLIEWRLFGAYPSRRFLNAAAAIAPIGKTVVIHSTHPVNFVYPRGNAIGFEPIQIGTDFERSWWLVYANYLEQGVDLETLWGKEAVDEGNQTDIRMSDGISRDDDDAASRDESTWKTSTVSVLSILGFCAVIALMVREIVIGNYDFLITMLLTFLTVGMGAGVVILFRSVRRKASRHSLWLIPGGIVRRTIGRFGYGASLKRFSREKCAAILDGDNGWLVLRVAKSSRNELFVLQDPLAFLAAWLSAASSPLEQQLESILLGADGADAIQPKET